MSSFDVFKRSAMDEITKQRAQTLRRLNLAAGTLHWVSFAVSLILSAVYRDQMFRTQLTTDWRLLLEPPPLDGGPVQAGSFRAQITTLGFYAPAWVELPFALITGAFHFYLALAPESRTRYVSYVLRKARNPYRWIEYAITASLMTWVILQVSGVTNVLTLVVVGVVGNVVLQSFGWMMELYNPPPLKRVSWWPTLAGWLLFAGQWTVIFAYFFAAAGSGRAPWFVYAVVVGMFVQFCAFGAVQLLYFTGRITAYRSEMVYVVLSLTSKLWLNWTLLAATLATPAS